MNMTDGGGFSGSLDCNEQACNSVNHLLLAFVQINMDAK